MDRHIRKCHDCGNIAEHTSRVTPGVLCPQCGSQDTRAVRQPVTPLTLDAAIAAAKDWPNRPSAPSFAEMGSVVPVLLTAAELSARYRAALERLTQFGDHTSPRHAEVREIAREAIDA